MESIVKFITGSKFQAGLTVFYLSVIVWLVWKIYRCGCCNSISGTISGNSGTSTFTLTGGNGETPIQPSNSGGGTATGTNYNFPTPTGTTTECGCGTYSNAEQAAKVLKCTINGVTKTIYEHYQDIATSWGLTLGYGNTTFDILTKPDGKVSIQTMCDENRRFVTNIYVPNTSNMSGINYTQSNVDYRITTYGCCAGLEAFNKWKTNNPTLAGNLQVNLGNLI